MQTSQAGSQCFTCSLNRRQFLAAGCAACAGAVGSMASAHLIPAAAAPRKPRIQVLYSLHAPVQDQPDWPNEGFDFRPAMQQFDRALKNECPGMEFVSATATGPEQAKSILEQGKAGGFDGYLVFQMNCWNQVVQTFAQTGKPVLYADFQFGGSGGFQAYTAEFLRKGTKNVGFIGSSRMEDLIEAVRCFEKAKAGDFAMTVAQTRIKRTPPAGNLACSPDSVPILSVEECLRRMKGSKILAVEDQKAGKGDPIMGIPVEYVSFSEVNDAWKAADRDESKETAKRWRKSATAVIDVSEETLENSAAMYLGMKSLLKKHGANAITINCLGGFYGGHIHAYPCLGFHELNNQGLVGGCEGDLRSAATMVAFGTLTQGRPGYISDPVLDTSKRQIIYAHCVATNRVFGPGGKPNPFTIMTHSEDRKGASIRSILPVGYMTTSFQIMPERKEILFHRAKTVANDPDDRACRTKLCAEPVGDFERMYAEWDRWGWHRVTFYGDLKESAHALADAMGWRMIPET